MNPGYGTPLGMVELRPVMPSSNDIPISCAVSGSNVTEQLVANCDLSSLVGKDVAFDNEVTGGALLYTVGFSSGDESHLVV